VTAMTVTALGEIVLAGYFNGSLTFATMSGTTTLSTPASDITNQVYAGFIAKLDGTGVPIWASQLGTGGTVLPSSLAIAEKGNIVVTGAAQLGASIALGGAGQGCSGVAPPALWTGSGFPFVVKLAGGGACIWENAFAVDLGYYNIGTVVAPPALAIDANDDILLAGGSRDPNNWGTTVNSVDPQMGDNQYTSYVAKLDGTSGQHVWDQSFGSSNEAYGQVASAITVETCGDIVIAGNFNGSVELDPLPAASLSIDAGSTYVQNVFLAKLTPTGQNAAPLTPVWVAPYGDLGTQIVTSLQIDPAAHYLLTGIARDAPGSTGLFFGSGQPLVNKSDNADAGTYGNDFFVAMLDRQGTYMRGWRPSCATQIGTSDPGFQVVQNLPGSPLAIDGTGDVFVTGQLDGTCKLGPKLTQLVPAGEVDLFLLGLQ